MRAFHTAADWLAGEAFRLQTAHQVELQPRSDRQLREDFGLSAQLVIRCIAQVCEADGRDTSHRPRFQQSASVPYDPRWMAFQGPDRVSWLTREGRLLVPVIRGKSQSERFTGKPGPCDLLRRQDGQGLLLVTVDLPDGAPRASTDFIGVDFGVVTLAVDRDGEMPLGDEVERTRQQSEQGKRSLPRKATKQQRGGNRPLNAKRNLKAISGRERRFQANPNHTSAKKIALESYRHRSRGGHRRPGGHPKPDT